MTTAQNQIAGELPADTERVPVATAVDIRSVVPPFENGTRRQEAARVMAEQEEGILIGGSCE